MAKQNYDEALRRLLLSEGGYSNHPSDPGGPTNFGITIIDYRKYVKPNATAADVKAMKVEEAKSIYRAKYWDAQKCDELPSGLDYSIFDYGVNSGIGRSGKVLRRILGMSDATSVVNAEVLAAVAKRDPKAMITAVNDERLRFLKALKTWPVFGAGWGRRVAEVKAYSLKIAGAPVTSPQPAPVPTPAPGKGAVPAPTVAKNAVKTGGPVAAAGGGFALWDWAMAHPVEGILAAALAVMVIVGGVQFLIRRHTSQQEAATPNVAVVPEASPA